ncbi:sensor histidine kinase [Nocardia jiangxiensis]|uniref:histidine kinase n=1 Tax=Nocardia jiangxiensis TaxID=282685 RepID=A0ABW6SA77_9NOCA|nr:nitrate- and nitrite sensing domain-containing protein [Nocardia jiangxiensis]
MQFRRARLSPKGDKRRNPAARLLRPRTIRGQLIRVLVVSVVLVLALLGVVLTSEVRAYRDSGDTVHAVSLALSVQDLVHEIQRERGLTNGMLGGDAAMRQMLDAQRPATDRALLALNATLTADAPGTTEVRTALAQLTSLSSTRAEVDGQRIDRADAFAFYTNAVAALDRTRPGLDRASDPRIWRGLQALYALGDVKEFTGQERGFLTGVFAANAFQPGEYVQFLQIDAAKQAALAAFPRDATASQRALLDNAMHSPNATAAALSLAVAAAAQDGQLAELVQPGQWWTQTSTVIDAERDVQRSIGADIQHRAQDLRRISEITLIAYTAAALVALLILVALVVTGVRAIVRPLAALAREADEVAAQRLPALIAAWQQEDASDPDPPEPVRTPHNASNEIVSVAEAFDRLQTTAFELASAQALLRRNITESLGNLGRRNQNLLRRQLGLISEFEREELDPKTLSNMFQLDHLATRMRRNAESLLVLVGAASPRRWSEPIPLTDVIRAALSEVEDYRRVVLRRIDDVSISGSAVSELAHMLAELIENGLAFSPPDVEVEIYGRRLGQQYMLAVVDHGIGLPEDQLAAANARLRGDADFLVAPTRFLGHYVVGRLAKRLGIEVELTASPISGVAARILLPTTLIGSDVALAAARKLEPAQPVWTTVSLPPAERLPALEPVAQDLAELTPGRTAAAIPAAAPTGPQPDGYSGFDVPGWPATPAHSKARRELPEGSGRGREQPERPALNPDAVELGDRPDPFPTLPAGPLKKLLNTTAAQRHQLGGPKDTAPASDSNGVHYTDAAPDPEVQRTRNGLVKRAKKIPGTTAPAPVVGSSGPPAAPAVDRSPEQVRGMLTSFRAGHRRGLLDEAPAVPASIAQEETR